MASSVVVKVKDEPPGPYVAVAVGVTVGVGGTAVLVGVGGTAVLVGVGVGPTGVGVGGTGVFVGVGGTVVGDTVAVGVGPPTVVSTTSSGGLNPSRLWAMINDVSDVVRAMLYRPLPTT